jgi:hypothetical protein
MKKYSFKGLVFLGVLFGANVFGSSSAAQESHFQGIQLRGLEILDEASNLEQAVGVLARFGPIAHSLKKIYPELSDEDLLELAFALSKYKSEEVLLVGPTVVEKSKMTVYDFLRAYFPCCFCRKQHNKKN